MRALSVTTSVALREPLGWGLKVTLMEQVAFGLKFFEAHVLVSEKSPGFPPEMETFEIDSAVPTLVTVTDLVEEPVLVFTVPKLRQVELN